MRKALILALPALAIVALAGVARATPMSASGALVTSPAIQEALPNNGVTEVRWWGGGRRRHVSRWCYFHPRRCY